ncbi:hypothetical protein EVAR_70940_1 [Eumeta japonica]|uniref:Uncharacterized protein n=1 Tax=Eumeta variegata TaxID=151549 RepID=A0A4C2ABJ5_EUMVA|nr:hypothetical protein EVAR_70940_1 [Eumeta japonica]
MKGRESRRSIRYDCKYGFAPRALSTLGQTSRRALVSKWFLSSMDTRSRDGVTSSLPASWRGIGFLMVREGGKTSHSLDKTQQWKLELDVLRIP